MENHPVETAPNSLCGCLQTADLCVIAVGLLMVDAPALSDL
jgi:hypothetical protein